ncbi:MAG: D-alanyl-D-alanine carboxypeptidase, partial [Oscillibacter sp.]|nr:D-alanyl-D-alanine carboxypeptidase [Oscillibacter sp.]
TLLDYGSANYTLKTVVPEAPLPSVPVRLGVKESVQTVLDESARTLLVKKAESGALTQSVSVVSCADAPVAAGDVLGTLTVSAEGRVVAEIPLLAGEDAARLTLAQTFLRLLRRACLG